jgi:cysteine-S-conjugate beta-lyase
VKEAKIGMNAGRTFGKGGGGFMRLNIASPRSVLAEALNRIASALEVR